MREINRKKQRQIYILIHEDKKIILTYAKKYFTLSFSTSLSVKKIGLNTNTIIVEQLLMLFIVL